MKRLSLIFAGALALVALAATPAHAAFGLNNFEVAVTNEDGTPATQAGSHPFAVTGSFGINYQGSGTAALVEGKVRDALVESVAGFTGDATAVPRCSTAAFLLDSQVNPVCPAETVVGIQSASFGNPDFFEDPSAVFNLPPPPGAPVRLGWKVHDVPVVIDVRIKQGPEYNAIVEASGVNQTLAVFGSIVELWGVPADPGHDLVRGECATAAKEPETVAEFVAGARIERPASGPTCPSNDLPAPFLTLPRRCAESVTNRYEVRSWQEPDVWVKGSFTDPAGVKGCGKLDFAPEIGSATTTDSAETSTGLDFSLSFNDEGLKNPTGLAQSDLEKIVVTLPEGVTVNPSIGEGLGVCTPGDLERETIGAAPGEGCPNSSKIGTLHVVSPLVDEAIEGSVFIAQQDDPSTSTPGAENPFDSLIAFYMVLKNPNLGVLVKLPAKVEPDPKTGQLVTTVEDIPQIPFSRLDFHFREGQRAPLVSPPACGTYTTQALLTPRADPSRVQTALSSFQITQGNGGGACPSGGVPPFEPGFEAGTLNNNAKSFSPFYMRLTRRDGDQDLTKFSAVLPPGVVGKLAGVGKCPDAQVALARAKTGRAELASPSCPSSSRIGRTLAGAGVGAALTYVPGSLYLAGPYKGAPLSVVSVTPALAGPFDAGTVVVRVALRINPRTAEVKADGAASDPIPHILKGIVLKVRDLRVYVDRPNFILNPTNCDPSSTRATLFGGFLNVFSALDDVPVDRSARHQAANCSQLPFKPRLSLRLKGGTSRGDHPGLTAVLKARPQDANIGKAVVTLPRSAFLDQGHIRTICTRVQFAADACPKGAQYGYAKAFTPLLAEPLQGPVYLRSSNNKLPDFVADLRGLVDVEVVGRIDSFRGGIRTTFANTPDAPLDKFVVRLQGGKKGLIVNSRGLCARKSRAILSLTGQNGKARDSRPLVKARCGKRKG